MSQSEIAAAYMFGTAVSAFAQIPIGWTVDRFGGRTGVTLYSALFALSVSAMALPSDWYTLSLAFCALRALGVGGLSLACTTCLQQWFCRRRGLATGLQSSAVSLSSYAILSNLISSVELALGWREAYTLFGGLLLCVYSPLALLLLRSRPEDVGLRPDGDDAPPAPKVNGGANGSRPNGAANGTGGDWTLAEAMRTRALWLLCVSNTLAWGFGAGIFFNLVSITREAGLDPADLAPCVYVPWAFTRAASMAISGALIDRFEPRFLLCVGALGVGVGFLLLAPPEGVELTPARGATFGIVHGGMNGLCNAVFRTAPARFFGRKHLGAIMGTMSMWNMAATAFGPLVIGASFDIFGSYRGCLTVVGAVNAGFSLVARFMTMPVRASERPDLTRHQSVQTPRGPVGALARMLMASGPSAVVDAMTPPARESARQTSQWLRVD